jgi:hypothetical protein
MEENLKAHHHYRAIFHDQTLTQNSRRMVRFAEQNGRAVGRW